MIEYITTVICYSFERFVTKIVIKCDCNVKIQGELGNNKNNVIKGGKIYLLTCDIISSEVKWKQ